MKSTQLKVCDISGPMTDLLQKFSGDNGQEWRVEFNKFLRKQPAWTDDIRPSKKNKPPLFTIVDLCLPYYVPDGLHVKEHYVGNERAILALVDDCLYVDGKELTLHSKDSERLADGKLKIYTLQDSWKAHDDNIILFNSNLLFFLITHPEFIPESWKSKRCIAVNIFFCNTRFYDDDDYEYVCYLALSGGKPFYGKHFISSQWDKKSPVAVIEC